jgi:hypothetical protein
MSWEFVFRGGWMIVKVCAMNLCQKKAHAVNSSSTAYVGYQTTRHEAAALELIAFYTCGNS